MKAIVLAFTLKGQDKDKIIAAVKGLKEEYGNCICIHGFMPRQMVLERRFSTDVVDAIEETFPVRLNMHDGKEVLREQMAEVANQLEAEVIVIGLTIFGVKEEVELYAQYFDSEWEPKFIDI